MALQLGITTEHGITLASSYTRVTNYSGDIDNIIVNTLTHADAAARTANDRQVKSEGYSFPAPTGALPAGGLIEWCYTQVKALAEFSGALDV